MERVQALDGTAEGMEQMIGFSVGEEEYGIDIHSVKEVIVAGQITSLPRAPSFVKGVINLRGDVIPIVDLRDKLGLGGKQADGRFRIIVVEVEGKSIGMIVDSVSRVFRMAADQIDEAPDWIGGLTREYLRGVARLGERLVILLRIERVLLENIERN